MTDEKTFLKVAGDKVRKFLGRSSKSDKEKLKEATDKIQNGEVGEEIIPELSEELNSNQEEVAGFIYYQLISLGLSAFTTHEQGLDRGYFKTGPQTLMYLMRFGITDFAERGEFWLEKAEEGFNKADKVAKDFSLGETAESFSERQISRIEERRKIYSEIAKISESVKTVEKASNFGKGGFHGLGKKLEEPENLEDYGTEHIMLLRDKIFKERSKIDPYSLDKKSTRTKFANPKDFLPVLINQGSNKEIRKLEQLMERRRKELGDKKKKLDQLTAKLDSICVIDKIYQEEKEVEKYSL